MARQPIKTPGSKTEPELVDTSTNAEEVLNEILSTPETAPKVKQPTAVLDQKLGEHLKDKLYSILNGQKRIENKIDSLLSAGGIQAPKKLRWVQGKNGLVQKEV